MTKVDDIYRRKRDVMLDALEERCSRDATWSTPEGGYFLWLTLAESVNPEAMYDAARRLGVAYVPGAAFHRGGGGQR